MPSPSFPSSLSGSLSVLTAMITPALLLSSCGTFILSTSNRLARVIDRVRKLSDRLEEYGKSVEHLELLQHRKTMLNQQMVQLSARATFLQRSLTAFYLAGGTFVGTSMTIGVLALIDSFRGWIAVGMAMVGATFFLSGCVFLILEARRALISLRGEMDFLHELVRHRQLGEAPHGETQ